jgi:hypothetical protein
MQSRHEADMKLQERASRDKKSARIMQKEIRTAKEAASGGEQMLGPRVSPHTKHVWNTPEVLSD